MSVGQVFPADALPAARVGRYRWRICALLLLATTINYIDRQVLGVLAPQLQSEIGWNEIEYGYIVIAAMGHSLAATVLGFAVARFALGLGEAGNFPAAIKTVANWFPCRSS